MSEIIEQLEEQIGKKLRHNEQLSTHTILQENTIAELYLEVETIDDLVKAVKAARNLDIPTFVFGSGSYTSLPDETILGLVIKNNARKFDKMIMTGKVRDQAIGVDEMLIQAESGTLINQLVRFTIEEGLSGLEYQLGMPGTVGGAIHTNAGYKKNFVRDNIQAIRILTDEGNVEMHVENLEKYFSDAILLSVIFRLTPEDKKILWERATEAGEYRSKQRS